MKKKMYFFLFFSSHFFRYFEKLVVSEDIIFI
jgi:hypothetical protein